MEHVVAFVSKRQIAMHYRLDALNFFLADVRGGLGAFVSVFLLTEARWSPAQIGAILTMSGLIGITLHTPVGALIDATRAKRALLVVGVALLAMCAIAIERVPTGPIVFLADIVMAVLGGVFAPTVAALTLGLVAEQDFTARLARNAVFDRIGNIFMAALVGFVGWLSSQHATFYLVPVFAFLSAWAVLSIPASAIDNDRARGFTGQQQAERPESWRRLLLHHRSLLILAATVAIFHFANASMLPLAGQKLALAYPGFETALLSACILVAQLATMPVAILVGAKADVWGRKPLLIAACLALVLRGIVFASFNSAPILVAAQTLDGISGGILDILLPLMLADIVGGTGRYSMSRGFLGTVQGVGGSISNIAAGTMVVSSGYSAAFAALTIVAAFAVWLVVFALPETGKR
jgi:predicted MFS family arabinose efflux permease